MRTVITQENIGRFLVYLFCKGVDCAPHSCRMCVLVLGRGGPVRRLLYVSLIPPHARAVPACEGFSIGTIGEEVMSKSKKNAAPVVPVAVVEAPVAVKPIDAAIALKAAQDKGIALIRRHIAVGTVYGRIGTDLTNAIIEIFNLARPGRERDLAMRPLLDAVMEKRDCDEKGAKKYLSPYLTNARKALDNGLAVDGDKKLSIDAVKKAVAEKTGQAPEAKRGGAQVKSPLEKAMDYIRPHIASLAETPSNTGGYSQMVEFLIWAAHEAKMEATYNGQHKVLNIKHK